MRLQRRSEKARKIWVGSGRVVSCRVTQISRAFHSVATMAPLNISLRLTKQTPGTRNIYS